MWSKITDWIIGRLFKIFFILAVAPSPSPVGCPAQVVHTLQASQSFRRPNLQINDLTLKQISTGGILWTRLCKQAFCKLNDTWTWFAEVRIPIQYFHSSLCLPNICHTLPFLSKWRWKIKHLSTDPNCTIRSIWANVNECTSVYTCQCISYARPMLDLFC